MLCDERLLQWLVLASTAVFYDFDVKVPTQKNSRLMPPYASQYNSSIVVLRCGFLRAVFPDSRDIHNEAVIQTTKWKNMCTLCSSLAVWSNWSVTLCGWLHRACDTKVYTSHLEKVWNSDHSNKWHIDLYHDPTGIYDMYIDSNYPPDTAHARHSQASCQTLHARHVGVECSRLLLACAVFLPPQPTSQLKSQNSLLISRFIGDRLTLTTLNSNLIPRTIICTNVYLKLR